MKEEIVLEVRDIEKSFPGVKALSNVNFQVKAGSVHALCGENGAGKSTLMKIIDGIYQPDQGEILVDGKPVKIKNPMIARSLGIGMIAQELNYFPDLSIEENLFIGRLPSKRPGKIDWKGMRQKSKEILKANGLEHLSNRLIRECSVSEIQQIEIAKALSLNARVIIMDEPTSSITESEVKPLFEKIKALTEQGIAIIYISHKLDEIFEIADEVTILRDGEVISTHPIETLDADKIISLMVGRKIDNIYPKFEFDIGKQVFKVDRLNRANVFKDISFHVNQGEIVGFAGLVGSGRTEVMRAIFGLDPYDNGTIEFEGKQLHHNSVRENIQLGMGMVTEDRKETGIVAIRSIQENASLSSLERFFYKGHHHKKEEAAVAKEYFQRMDVKAPSLETPIGSLSGGNQQKVILSKWLMRKPTLLILDEPTRGIDVGNKYEIYKIMGQLAKEGMAIILVSSELPELIGMCDRIYVMSSGQITGEIDRSSFNQETIMSYATVQ